MNELERLGVRADVAAPDYLDITDKALLSLLVILAVIALRFALSRLIRGRDSILSDRQRWWLIFVKNIASVMILATLLLIWGAEIQNVALSLAAVAAALVIATKELILCVIAAIWRSVARPFSVGDWVEIGPFSGEVVDETPFMTMLQEIDPYDYLPTGRMIAAPNSLLLTQPVVNHQFRKRFLFLEFSIYSEPHEEAEAQRAAIEAAVAGAAGDFAELAQRYVQRIESASGAKLRDPAAHVALGTTHFAKLEFRVTVFCPRERAVELKRAAMAAFTPKRA